MRADTNTVFVDDEAEENWFSIGLRNVRERKELKIQRNELKVKVAYLKKELKKVNESYLIHQDQLEKVLELIQDGKALLADRDLKIETIEHELEQTKDTVKVLRKVLKDNDILGQMVTREKYDEAQRHLATVIKTVKERNAEFANLTQSLQVAIADRDDLKMSLSSMEKELMSAKSTIKKQNDNLTKLNGGLASSEKNIDKLSSELNTATVNLTTVTIQRDDLQKALDLAEDTIASCKLELKNKDRDVSGLNEKLSCRNSELKSLGSELSSTTASLSKATADCDTLQESLDSARTQVVSLQSIISEQTAALSRAKAIWDTKTAECADLDTITDKCTYSNGDLEMVIKNSEQLSAMIFEAQQKPSEIERLKQALEMVEIMLALSASTNLKTIYDEGRRLEDHQLPVGEYSYTSRIIKSQAQELKRDGARIAKQEEDIKYAGEINGDLELELLRLRSLLGDAGPCTRFEQVRKEETKEWCECIKCSTYKQLSKKFLGRIQLLEEESFVMAEQIKELGSPHPQFAHLERLHRIRVEQLEFEAQLNKDEIQYLRKKAATDKAFYCASQMSLEKDHSSKEDIVKSIEPVGEEDQEENMKEEAEEDYSRHDDDDYDDSASDSSIEFVGTDNLKKSTPKPSTVVQDLIKQTEMISPLTTEKSTGSEREVLPTITAAESVSTPNLPNDTAVPNDNLGINAIIFAQEDQDADCTVQLSDKGDELDYTFARIKYGSAEESILPCSQLDLTDLKIIPKEPIEVLCQINEEPFSVQDEYAEFLNGLGEDLKKENTRNDIDAAEYDHEQHEVGDFDEEDDYDLELAEFLAEQDTIGPLEVSQATVPPEPKKTLAPTVPVFTPTAPVSKPTAPVIIPTAAVITPKTTVTVALVQEHAGQENISLGMTESVHYPAAKTDGSIGKPEKKPSSLCRFCEKSTQSHPEDACGMNPKNVCRFCEKSNHTHTEDKCHRNPKNKKSRASRKHHFFCKHCGDPDHKQERCFKYKYFMQINNEIKAVALCSATPAVEPSQQSIPVGQITRVVNGNDRAGRGRQTPQLCKFCNHEGHTENNCPKKKEENMMLQKMYEIQPNSAAPSKNLSRLNSTAPTGRLPSRKKTGGLLGSKYAPGYKRDSGNVRNDG